MPLAFLDCPTGLAGDMLLAALFDLGLPLAVVEEPLAQLGLSGAYRLRIEEARSGGLRGRRLTVEGLEQEPVDRRWLDLRQRIATSALEPVLGQRVLAVFTLLAEAEGAVHGHPPEQVHFHEVGAVDALVDVVGVCAGLIHFQVDRLICAPPPAGHGTVRTAHGLLPLPAPAVLELARRSHIPLKDSAGFPAGELTTPTGLALLAIWADQFGGSPTMVPAAVGIGLGHRVLDRPNLLRLWLAEQGAAGGDDPFQDFVLVQQAQIDDATPEEIAFLAEELRRAGALEVFTQSAQMKKGRAGVVLTVVARPEDGEKLRALWWRHGSSLGVREQLQHRWCLPREERAVATPWGPVRVKLASTAEGEPRFKAEFEDLAAIARRQGLTLAVVRQAVARVMAEDNAAMPSDEPPC